ncbi:porin [Aquabacterium olei]|nr:porin [Aquabacterium olei]
MQNTFTSCALRILATFTLTLSTLSVSQAQVGSALVLYGAVDLSLTHVSNTNAAGQDTTSIASGSFLPSVWGIRGQEDLGGGLQAFFKLENSFNVDTGAVTTNASFFNRFALLGLRTPYGTVTAGRLGSMQFDFTAMGYDLTMLDTYGIVALGALPPALFKINNAIKYESPTWGGWRGSLMTSSGQELPEASGAGRYSGAAIEYAQGDFKARATHEVTRGNLTGTLDQSGLTDKRTSVAARWNIDALSLFADYVSVQGDLRITPRGHVWQGGVGYRIAPRWQLIGEFGVYRYSDSNGRPALAHLIAQYDLSKRTLLYGFWTKVNNHGGSQVGAAFATSTSKPGQSQSALGLGVSHRF